ncbi:hypothetical protein FZI95_04995 [Mycobacterium sp. CBMA247]|nr:hypothetical protein [Mycolicibacterium sp. CBMA 329]MUL86892.1 hypothetical protein [Mycolicibacterium sp. CBMA 331]MUL98824.1 hypothetical protein [Mycolicibacterium sp. CBMA 334]MUM29103.1 hypothetical protein [Mycolicibacterium sp. CBMA 295]MUM37189.1 hypothetical protein [Mycolicibacterium sp. CBMA 247]MUM42957.1 hypothetical protein [Mycolicibacterium sp. CBMA 294]
MRADMAAIRALGDALCTHAAELDAVAAALRSMPSPAAALGPIGDRFVTAFTEAVSRHSDAVAVLGVRTGSGAGGAGDTATLYEAAGQRAAQLLPRV